MWILIDKSEQETYFDKIEDAKQSLHTTRLLGGDGFIYRGFLHESK